ncbi:MAG: hypothetical protein WBA22_08285 [Candidatus Methanofastidiosia archaeon]
MYITFQRVKPALYFSFWVVIVIGILMMWFLFFGDYMYEYALPLVCGCTVGILSGLSPGRTFLTCFCGFFIISAIAVLTIPNSLALFTFFTFLGIFCGLIALACSVIRGVVLRSKTEQLHLATWQWAILIGSASTLACYILISFPYKTMVSAEDFVLFFKFVSLALMGLFALGLYAGAYYHRSYRTIVRDILLFSLGGHLVFVFFMVYVVRFWHVWKDPLFFPMMAVYFLVLLLGTRIGYRFKKTKNTQIQENSNMQSQEKNP